jgi:hypothetical protein
MQSSRCSDADGNVLFRIQSKRALRLSDILEFIMDEQRRDEIRQKIVEAAISSGTTTRPRPSSKRKVDPTPCIIVEMKSNADAQKAPAPAFSTLRIVERRIVGDS